MAWHDVCCCSKGGVLAHRNGFRHITATCAELVDILHAVPPGRAVDVDQACLCETMDVIGLFGFGQSFEAVKCART